MNLDHVISQACATHGIARTDVIAAVERAVHAAADRHFGDSRDYEARYDEDTGEILLHAYYLVTEEVEDPNREVSLADLERCETFAELGEEVGVQLFYRPEDSDRARAQDEQFRGLLGVSQRGQHFGRIAASAARSAIATALRDSERRRVVEAYGSLVGQPVLGVVHRIGRHDTAHISLGGGVVGMLAKRDQHPRDRLSPGQQVVCVVAEVSAYHDAPPLRLTRASAECVRHVIEWETPAVASGEVIIDRIARIPGKRSKVLVRGKWEDTQPVALCVGEHGTRVRGVVDALIGERVDYVEVAENAADTTIAMDAIGVPCDVCAVEEDGSITLVVDDADVGLAIGPRAINKRLVSQLVGREVNIAARSTWESDAA